MKSNADEFTHSVVNLEETIGKAVGRRGSATPLDLETSNREIKEKWRRHFGGIGVPRGVFRFQSHEEADQWMIQKLAETAAKRGQDQGNLRLKIWSTTVAPSTNVMQTMQWSEVLRFEVPGIQVDDMNSSENVTHGDLSVMITLVGLDEDFLRLALNRLAQHVRGALGFGEFHGAIRAFGRSLSKNRAIWRDCPCVESPVPRELKDKAR